MRINPIEFVTENADSLHLLLDLIPLPMYIKDIDGKYLTCNQAFEETTGLTLNDIAGKDVYAIWPKEQADIFDLKDQELYENPDIQDYETDVITPFNTQLIMRFRKKILYDAHHNAVGYLGVLFDITEKKLLENLLISQAVTDELTQIPNRRDGLARLAHELRESVKKNTTLCLAMIDIDHFKQVNDTYGHAAGDAVLMTVANVLKSSVREYDIFARHGGEEFLVCLPDTNISQATEILERLRIACESAETVSNKETLKITVSIGVVESPAQGTTLQLLLDASDQALYRAKKAGRNCIAYVN